MYNEYFGFSESPFENNLDQRFLFLSEDHKEVLAALQYFIRENKAFVMLCGDVGAGKTTLLNSFLDRLPKSYTPIIISNPSVEYREILLYVARSLGIADNGQKVLDLIDDVKNVLVERKKDEKYCFLVIDEAHLLSDHSLDDIRLLSNIETPDRKLLPILLVGQYELSYKLQNVKMRQLRQRISINRFLSSLDFVETSRYIEHRLHLVGSSLSSCFEKSCLSLLYKITDGVPRQINQICDNALLICKTTGLKKINKKILKKTHAALRSDLLFTPRSLKEKSEKSFLPWKILKPVAVICVMALLFIGGLRYSDVIKPLRSSQPSALKTTDAPATQNKIVPEKRFQEQQTLPASPTASSPEATTQLVGEDTVSNVTTSPDKTPQPLPQLSAEALDKIDPIRPSSPELQTIPAENLPLAPSSTLTLNPATSAAPVSEKPVEEKAEAKPFSDTADQQPGGKSLKEKKELTLVKTDRISEASEKSQQASSVPAANQGLTASERNEPGTQDTQKEYSDPHVGEQQTITSSKITVKNGDNLTEIALQHYPHKEKSVIEAIIKSNPQIENRNLIYPGQVLVLPEIKAKEEERKESGKITEHSFAVQVCTLCKADRAFAEAYVAELKQKGYPAYSIEMQVNNGKILYKIFIGTYSTREEAETAARVFQKKENNSDILIKTERLSPLESKVGEKKEE